MRLLHEVMACGTLVSFLSALSAFGPYVASLLTPPSLSMELLGLEKPSETTGSNCPPALPRPHVPRCHIHKASEHLLEWGVHHCLLQGWTALSRRNFSDS